MQQVQQMQQQVGYFCGVPGKAQNPADIIEIVDRSTEPRWSWWRMAGLASGAASLRPMPA